MLGEDYNTLCRTLNNFFNGLMDGKYKIVAETIPSYGYSSMYPRVEFTIQKKK